MPSRAGWCDRRRVKRALASVATVVLATCSVVQLTTDTAAAGDDYRTYAACSIKAGAKPAKECKLSQPKAAYFVSTQHDSTYKVCVRFPGKKKRLCASAQDAPKGKTKIVTIATANTGRHRITWYVAGKKVGSWTLDVIAD
jgi:hypothetical protein